MPFAVVTVSGSPFAVEIDGMTALVAGKRSC